MTEPYPPAGLIPYGNGGSTRKLWEDYSDGDLLTAVREGSSEAYGELFNRHLAAATRVARRHILDQHAAMDVVHDAFTRILAAIKAGTGPVETFTAYLYTSITREVRKRNQRLDREVLVPDHEGLHPWLTADLTDEILGHLFGDEDLQQAFRTLPRRWQLALWYLDVHDMSPKQAAGIFGITPNALCVLHRRAKTGLRRAINQTRPNAEINTP